MHLVQFVITFVDVLKLDHDIGILVYEAIYFYFFIIGHAVTIFIHVVSAIWIELPANFCHSIFKLAYE